MDSMNKFGKAYAIGLGETCGELGLGDVTETDSLTLIDALKDEEIRDIQSGYMHTLALTRQGKIWSWGGNEFGALGREGIESEPRPLNHSSIKYIRFTKVACGYTCSMAISTKGQLYTWGTLTSGKDTNDLKPQRYPCIFDLLADQFCIDIAIGRYHCLCLTRDGSVYSWGQGEHWQVGHKIQPYRFNLPCCTSVVSGALHSLALDCQGCLFAWGQNQFGQCGLDSPLVLEPTLIIDDCISVAAGDYHTIVLNKDHSLTVFGRCEEGQLGIPIYPGYIYPGSRCHAQRVFAICHPFKNPWRPGERVVRVMCGCNSTLVQTEFGKLFFWGASFFLNDKVDKRVPILLNDLLEIDENIVTMSIGDSFSILALSD